MSHARDGFAASLFNFCFSHSVLYSLVLIFGTKGYPGICEFEFHYDFGGNGTEVCLAWLFSAFVRQQSCTFVAVVALNFL